MSVRGTVKGLPPRCLGREVGGERRYVARMPHPTLDIEVGQVFDAADADDEADPVWVEAWWPRWPVTTLGEVELIAHGLQTGDDALQAIRRREASECG